MATFVFDKDNREFIATDSQQVSKRFTYQPAIANCWENVEDFDLYLMQHPIPRKESDISTLYLTSNPDESVGWIFPISILNTDTIDPQGRLLDYVFISFQILLNRIETFNAAYDDGNLLDSYDEKAIVLILNKKYLPDNFDVEQYRFSLYEKGFSIGDKSPSGIPFYQYNQASHVNLVTAETPVGMLPNAEYFKRIFTYDLIETNNPIHRFLILYQVIEIFMDDFSEHEIITNINKYTSKEIGKNDLMHAIRDAVDESDNIQKIFNSITNLPQGLKSAFIDSVNTLYREVGYDDSKNDIANVVYSLRNQLFHSYRRYIGREELLYTAIQNFEKLVINLLIHYVPPID